jgi:hypothetical protein
LYFNGIGWWKLLDERRKSFSIIPKVTSPWLSHDMPYMHVSPSPNAQLAVKVCFAFLSSFTSLPRFALSRRLPLQPIKKMKRAKIFFYVKSFEMFRFAGFCDNRMINLSPLGYA